LLNIETLVKNRNVVNRNLLKVQTLTENRNFGQKSKYKNATFSENEVNKSKISTQESKYWTIMESEFLPFEFALFPPSASKSGKSAFI